MNEQLVLVGGGRKSEDKMACRQSFRDIEQVLAAEYSVRRVWVDEHGLFWLEEDGARFLCSLQANKLLRVAVDQIVIGGEVGAEYWSVDRLWPLFYGGDYADGGLLGSVDFGGYDLVGTGGNMSFVTHDKDLVRLVLPNYNFAKKPIIVGYDDWQKNHWQREETLLAALSFPVLLKSGDKEQLVSVKDNLSNSIFSFFEDNAGSNLEIESRDPRIEKLLVGFLGRENFLPSRVCQIKNGLVGYEGDTVIVRAIQNMVIDFVKNYRVNDYGLFHLEKEGDDWRIVRIDLHPDVSRAGELARVWQESGVDYDIMIKKIINHS
ncbi:MAG: hypothetical protein WC570_02390 [Patescibacteria group bacterium]